MYELSVLENGLKVATCNLSQTKSVAVGLWVRTGGRYETKSFSGISHFFEHMVFKGSEKRSCRQIKESIEGVGGMLNGFTSEEVTCFLAKVLHKHLPITLDVLIDMLLNPLLRQADIDKERLVIFEEIKMYLDLPHHLAYDNMQKMLWPDHPLGRNLGGSEKTLKKINRNEIIYYKNKYYNLKNMTICASGNIDHSILIETLSKIFSKTKQKNNMVYRNKGFKSFALEQKEHAANFIDKETQQSHLVLGMHAIKRDHALKYALIILHIILGANMSSRLFNQIREKRGLAYEIGTSLKKFEETGAFLVHAGIVRNKIENACALILAEFKKVCSEYVTKRELQRAKEYFSGHLLMSLDDPLDHMLWVGEKVINNRKVIPAHKIIQSIESVTQEDVMRIANLIFQKGNFNLSVVGILDERKKKNLTDLLKGFKK